jgi:polyhydroxyalkanoate synthase
VVVYHGKRQSAAISVFIIGFKELLMTSTKSTNAANSAEHENFVPTPDPVELAKALAEAGLRAQKIMADAFDHQDPADLNILLADVSSIGKAFVEAGVKLWQDPVGLVEKQLAWGQEAWQLWQNSWLKAFGESSDAVIDPPAGDRRFRDAAWEENAVFDFVKQSYLLASKYISATVGDVDGLDEKTQHKVEFYTKQLIDALSPSNFVATNPEVLRTTVETGGENLVKGLNNMLDDLERGHGQLKIRLTDLNAFAVGENLATTPGKVVFENDMFQLIQYSPSTEKVAKRPLLIVPPWINKFYILDLQAKNSFIKWVVDQGQTTFLVSWVNPDIRHTDASFTTYMTDGLLAAVDAVQQATGEEQVNIIGYCIGGTLLAASLAYLQHEKKAPIASATYFTTLVDFANSGDLEVFVDEEQLTALEAKMAKTGCLEGDTMATTFNMLRANDLIWSSVVNYYLMGKDPFPFDLLYWNSDSTRLPGKMHSFYLRNMYLENRLIQPNGIQLNGVGIDVSTITVPSFLLSAREDHIAPWPATYTATQLYKGPVKFVLGGSGHIAGVINHPDANKYQYWTNDKNPKDPEAWLAGATATAGSWWPEWQKWVGQYSDGQVPARQPGSGKLKAIEDAPGSYVKVRL